MKKKEEADSAGREEAALVHELPGTWHQRGAVWGGPIEDLRAAWENPSDHDWAGPVGRLFGAIGMVFLLVQAFLSALRYPLDAIVFLVLAVPCAWLLLRSVDVRPVSARERIAAALLQHAQEVMRLPPAERPEAFRVCEPPDGPVQNSYVVRLGIGTRFGMGADYDPETDSYARNRYFALGHLPVAVLGRYRVIDGKDRGHHVVGRHPLRARDRAMVAPFWLLVVGALFMALGLL